MATIFSIFNHIHKMQFKHPKYPLYTTYTKIPNQ